jgi:hypothetical protein
MPVIFPCLFSPGSQSQATPGSDASVVPRPSGIYHYGSNDKFTRYKLCVTIGGLLGLPTGHVTGDPAPPPGAPRPHDAFLHSGKLAAAGLAAPCVPFEEGMRLLLDSFVVDPVAKTITPRS